MSQVPYARWRKSILVSSEMEAAEELVAGRELRIVAVAHSNGTWHTFDRNGIGGENDVEKSLARAKIEAAASAIEQGFI